MLKQFNLTTFMFSTVIKSDFVATLAVKDKPLQDCIVRCIHRLMVEKTEG